MTDFQRDPTEPNYMWTEFAHHLQYLGNFLCIIVPEENQIMFHSKHGLKMLPRGLCFRVYILAQIIHIWTRGILITFFFYRWHILPFVVVYTILLCWCMFLTIQVFFSPVPVVENPNHCEFSLLRDFMIRWCMQLYLL